jgi:predicted NBD/HSP70 family sugar kinase
MYLGVDIGGTKTLLAVFDDAGTLLEQIKFPTPPDYQTFLKDLAESISQHLTHKTFTAAGVGVPGLLDRTAGTVKLLSNIPWRDKPIRQDIAQIVNCPVAIENDSKAGALSEARLVLNQYKQVLYLTLGTGISGGLVVNGMLDPCLLDAEYGQVVFPHDNKLMSWEAFTSGKAVFEQYGKKASDIDDPAIWQVIASNLGLGVIAACAITQAEAVIFGGGIGMFFDKFAAPLQAFIDQNLPPIVRKPVLLRAQHAEQAVVYGCYELAKQLNG